MNRVIRIDLRFPEGRAKCLTLSYDDGWEQDIRLCELMKKHGIAGTFNLSPGLFDADGSIFSPGLSCYRLTTRNTCRDTYDSPLFEVATHGLNHKFLDRLPTSEAVYETVVNRRELESIFGTVCRGHAYPYGTYNSDVVRIMGDCGIAYARTTLSTNKFDLPDNWLILNPTCHHKSPKLPELTEKFLAAKVARAPLMFYLWGHTYELDKDDNWNVIEEFFEKIGGQPDIWYATNIQICDYVRSFRSLIYSADGNRVFNPTVTDLWLGLNCGKKTVLVGAGQTVDLQEAL